MVVTTKAVTRRRWLGGLAAGAWSAAAVACGPTSSAGPGTTGEPRRETASSNVPPAVNVPGRLLYVGDSNVWLWEKGSARKLTNDRISRQPAWSPDGKRIAHVKLDVSSSELWLMDGDGASSRQLTNNTNTVVAFNNWAFRPTWWPDGSYLLYLSEERTNDLMLWQITLDGKTHKPFLTMPDLEGGLDMPSVAPDGKRLALVSYRGPGGRSQVWTYALPSGPWRQLTEAPDGAYDPQWSPDGTRIAFALRTGGRNDVYVMAADGSNPLPVTRTGSARAPCWSPDGQQLAYISSETGGFELWVATLAGTRLAPTGTAGAPRPADTALPPSRQLTRGALIDAVSGLSWSK